MSEHTGLRASSHDKSRERKAVLDAIETLLKEGLAGECRAYLRRLYLDLSEPRKEAT